MEEDSNNGPKSCLSRIFFKGKWSPYGIIVISDFYLRFNLLEKDINNEYNLDGLNLSNSLISTRTSTSYETDTIIDSDQEIDATNRNQLETSLELLWKNSEQISNIITSIETDDLASNKEIIQNSNLIKNDKSLNTGLGASNYLQVNTLNNRSVSTLYNPTENSPQKISPSTPSNMFSSSFFGSLTKSVSSAFDYVKNGWSDNETRPILTLEPKVLKDHEIINEPIKIKELNEQKENKESFSFDNVSNYSLIDDEIYEKYFEKFEFIVFLQGIRQIQMNQNILNINMKNSMLFRIMIIDPNEAKSKEILKNPIQSIALSMKIKSFIKKKIRSKLFYCYSSNNEKKIYENCTIYDVVKEFKRQKVLTEDSKWKITHVNNNYKVCESYPTLNIVPKTLSDSILEKASLQRAHNRFTILSWCNPNSGLSIFRAAQPCSGISLFSGKNSLKDDEEVLRLFNETNTFGKKLSVLDLRSKLAANANRLKGYGYEIDYSDVELHFMNIGNIHAVRSSYLKLLELIQTTSGNSPTWLSSLEKTQWLEYINLLLQTTEYCKTLLVKEHTSCLLHCSDSWDRTNQIISLTLLLLDPYYRTLEGFAVLIEKEWITSGHLFTDRNLIGEYKPKSSQYSPIFYQFIETLYQLFVKYPTAFEFNENYLLDLSDAIYTCEYSDFIFNNEMERMKTPAASSFFKESLTSKGLEKYLNLNYKAIDEILSAEMRVCDVDLWKKWWFRFIDYL